MKKLISVLGISIVVFGLNSSFGQVNEESAKEIANKLFNMCLKENYSSASNLLAYHGSDESRLYKDTYTYSNSTEAAEVKRLCNRIKAMIEISDSYDFGSFRNRKSNGKQVQSLDIIFKSGNQKIKNKLTFISINGSAVVLNLD